MWRCARPRAVPALARPRARGSILGPPAAAPCRTCCVEPAQPAHLTRARGPRRPPEAGREAQIAPCWILASNAVGVATTAPTPTESTRCPKRACCAPATAVLARALWRTHPPLCSRSRAWGPTPCWPQPWPRTRRGWTLCLTARGLARFRLLRPRALRPPPIRSPLRARPPLSANGAPPPSRTVLAFLAHLRPAHRPRVELAPHAIARSRTSPCPRSGSPPLGPIMCGAGTGAWTGGACPVAAWPLLSACVRACSTGKPFALCVSRAPRTRGRPAALARALAALLLGNAPPTDPCRHLRAGGYDVTLPRPPARTRSRGGSISSK
jgi:hypothetical protein